MAVGRRQGEQAEFWVATQDLPSSPGHPFYEHLNKLLGTAAFDLGLMLRVCVGFGTPMGCAARHTHSPPVVSKNRLRTVRYG